MSTEPRPVPANMFLVWTGRVISALPVLMLLYSASMKFTTSKQLTEGMTHLGWDSKVAVVLGITELACTILYAIPQTSVLGAILLTGYMGGAIATHARIGEAFYFQAGLGVLVWLGLFLREPRLRAILPWRS
jgi:DoxX-like protein